MPVAAMLATFAVPAGAQTPPTQAQALAAIRAFAPVAMERQGTPGLSVAITNANGTIDTITLGYANTDAKTPVTPDTRFAIGSITKSMTALALMQLYDAGSLQLDQPVRRYLPWFRINSGGKPVLVHQILSHTAGIPDDYASQPAYRYNVVSLAKARVLFPPGTSWSYSNDGYDTAGTILSTLDRRPWSDSVQARVLDRIGMTATSPVFTPQMLASAALGYQWRDNDRPGTLHPALVPSPSIDFVDPAGSVLATPEDMARYMRFFLNGGRTANGNQLISQRAFDRMTHPDRLNNGKPAGAAEPELAEAPQFYRQYGFGLSIESDGGDRVVGHTGGVSGYTACTLMNLTRGFGVVAMANLVEAPLHPCAIVLYAMQVLRAQSLGQALPQPPTAPDLRHVDRAEQYTGTYSSAGGRRFSVAESTGQLSLTDGNETAALYPRGDDTFWVDSKNFELYELNFGRDRNGRIVEANYGSDWYANERYAGPRTFSHPASWDALVGRYENEFAALPTTVTRVLIVKNHLTLDGTAPLTPRSDGTFSLGSSIVRFDARAGTQQQRMWVDDTPLYRVELP
ncbi:MAG TPA: serine hydrolase domain-containing protein [Candidatus Tumulicola sp.]